MMYAYVRFDRIRKKKEEESKGKKKYFKKKKSPSSVTIDGCSTAACLLGNHFIDGRDYFVYVGPSIRISVQHPGYQILKCS